MLLKWIVFFVALTAQSWLWGQWSLASSLRTSLLLLASSVLLLVLIGAPIRALLKKQSVVKLFQSYWMIGVYYTYVVLVIVLSAFQFSGLIQILLPIKITLLISYAYLKYKLKPAKQPQTDAIAQTERTPS